MNILVGYTGFVGSNIYATGEFDKVYNTKNIEEAFGVNPDLLVYSGVRAEKYLANNDPEKDLSNIMEAFSNIQKINPKKLVLISTIDVYKNPVGVDESSEMNAEELQAYGKNRLILEEKVREVYGDALIIRLPGLYGINIKKNFIYDLINIIPFMLKEEKYQELSRNSDLIANSYSLQDNGFYKCMELQSDQKEQLKVEFINSGFTALNFTDSRSVFQFYPLIRLWADINIALENNLNLLNLATEPVSAEEVYEHIMKKEFVNHLAGVPFAYDYRTENGTLFGGKDGYLMTKEEILQDIKSFVEGMRGK